MKWVVRKGHSPKDPKEKNFFEEIELKNGDGNPKLKKELENLGYKEWITYPIPQKDSNLKYTETERQAKKLYGNMVYDDLPEIYYSGGDEAEKPKRKYEIWCGGFLFYHDVVFKNYPKGKGHPSLEYPNGKEYKVEDKIVKDFEHKIYFEWLAGGTPNEKNKVRIYINFTPKQLNSDPPPPKSPPPP